MKDEKEEKDIETYIIQYLSKHPWSKASDMASPNYDKGAINSYLYKHKEDLASDTWPSEAAPRWALSSDARHEDSVLGKLNNEDFFTEQEYKYLTRYIKNLRMYDYDLCQTDISLWNYDRLINVRNNSTVKSDKYLPTAQKYFRLRLSKTPKSVFCRYVGGLIGLNTSLHETLATEYYEVGSYKEALLVSLKNSEKSESLRKIRDNCFNELCDGLSDNAKEAVRLLKEFPFPENEVLLIERIRKCLNEDAAIDFYKHVLELYQNENLFNEIICLLKNKYSNKKSVLIAINVNSNFKNINHLLELIERIQYEEEYKVDAFVLHNDWGLGRIKNESKDEFTIQFLKKKDLHKMSKKMAYNVLKVLPKSHIKVLKVGALEELKKRVKDDPCWAFKMLIKSYDGSVTLAEVRKELDGPVLNNYFSWIQNAIDKVNKDRHFLQIAKEGRIAFTYVENEIDIPEIKTDLPVIPPQYCIYIRPNNFSCSSKQHTVRPFFTFIPVKSQSGVKTVKVYVDYCKDCKKFYISSNEFDSKLSSYSDILLRCFVSPSGIIYGPLPASNNSNLSEESVLKQAGYSVSKQDDLSPFVRQQILDEVILYGILDVAMVKNYLQFFIGYLGKNENMSDAVDNWMIDLNYINHKYSKPLSFFDE